MDNWIAVFDQWPPDDTDVLVCNERGEVMIGRYDTGAGMKFPKPKWKAGLVGRVIPQPVDWQPLPAPRAKPAGTLPAMLDGCKKNGLTFGVYGIDCNNLMHLIEAFADNADAVKFASRCIEYDKTYPEQPTKHTSAIYAKRDKAVSEWARNHPAHSPAYMSYIVQPI
jgi:hypothetical protein